MVSDTPAGLLVWWSHLFILLVCEVVCNFVPQSHHVLDGGLPDGPGSLAVGVEAAVWDLATAAPPAAKAAPLVAIELRTVEGNPGTVVQHEHPAAPGVVGLPGVVEADGAPVGAVDSSVAATVGELAVAHHGPAGSPGPEAAVPSVVERGPADLHLGCLVQHQATALQAGGGDVAVSDRPPPSLTVHGCGHSGSEMISLSLSLSSIEEYATSPWGIRGQVRGAGVGDQDTARDLKPLAVL